MFFHNCSVFSQLILTEEGHHLVQMGATEKICCSYGCMCMYVCTCTLRVVSRATGCGARDYHVPLSIAMESEEVAHDF